VKHIRAFAATIAALGSLALGSCTRGAKIRVTVVSPTDVRFSGETGDDDEPFCLQSAGIAVVGGPPVWETMPPLNAASCEHTWTFPSGGKNFRFIRRINRLKPGRYYTTVSGSGRYGYAEFVVE
jgi:hypothetical protein